MKSTNVTMTNAQRQAAWRQRRQDQGKATLLLQAHLEPDILAGLDAYAAKHKTNRVKIIRTLLLDLLRQDEQEHPAKQKPKRSKGRAPQAPSAGVQPAPEGTRSDAP